LRIPSLEIWCSEIPSLKAPCLEGQMSVRAARRWRCPRQHIRLGSTPGTPAGSGATWDATARLYTPGYVYRYSAMGVRPQIPRHPAVSAGPAVPAGHGQIRADRRPFPGETTFEAKLQAAFNPADKAPLSPVFWFYPGSSRAFRFMQWIDRQVRPTQVEQLTNTACRPEEGASRRSRLSCVGKQLV
jgi:hypothetical protein